VLIGIISSLEYTGEFVAYEWQKYGTRDLSKMIGWENFFIAEVGASAALLGLLFVGVSINLARILSLPGLPNRALLALIILLTILVVSSLLLVPGQSLTLVGIELLVVGLFVWIIATRLDVIILLKKNPQYRVPYVLNITLTQFALLPYIVAGIIVLTRGAGSLYWLVPAIVISFMKALLDAWVFTSRDQPLGVKLFKKTCLQASLLCDRVEGF
jgi:hypothetical protein